MSRDDIIRVGLKFSERIKFIQSKRLEIGKDKKKVSFRKLTEMIPKHKLWLVIEEELINYDFNIKK